MELLLTAITTGIGSFVGVLLGIHLGRRYYGLAYHWEGWNKEIEWLRRALQW